MKITLYWRLARQPHTVNFTDKDTIIIGRQRDCAILIPEEERYQTISRRHAQILAEEDAFYLRNLSQTNAINLNGQQRIEPGKQMVLSPNDTFAIGPIRFRVLAMEATADRSIVVRCTNLQCDRLVNGNLFDCPFCGTSLAFAKTTYSEP
jgi:predicted component of type VI protein secretion system